ncbi:MAG: MBL fold metallo-hydrolase, partial [Candidatus Omnitrophica bacterium]|nr:MBL fold metallo-hydrolase [Candidatus Omnitrophota bacterium]
VSYKNTQLIIDPGPGSLVRCIQARPKLDPSKLDGIILTHKHLDHSGDLPVMIEAMTEGGFKKRGVLFCPSDALEKEDRVVPGYALEFPEKIEILKPNTDYLIKDIKFKTSPPHLHPVETYGLKLDFEKTKIGLMVDTAYSDGLVDFYKRIDILILAVVFFQPREDVQHLSLAEAEILIKKIKPKKVILTHFGMTMLKAKPHVCAEDLTKRINIEIISAYDGMSLDF